jgi:HPt (histidine-containing phosphotransfer) domain-containing protein
MDNKQVDIQYIYGIAGGEEEFVIEIINNFLNSSDARLEKLLSDLQNDRFEDLHFDAHKLKGTFRFIGASRLGNIMEDIEKKAANGIAIEDVGNLTSEVRQVHAAVVAELKEILQTITSGK